MFSCFLKCSTKLPQSAHDLEGWEECWSLQDLFLRFTFLSNSALPFERPGYQYNMTPEDKTNHLGVEVTSSLFQFVCGWNCLTFNSFWVLSTKSSHWISHKHHSLQKTKTDPLLLIVGDVRTFCYPTSRGLLPTSLVLQGQLLWVRRQVHSSSLPVQPCSDRQEQEPQSKAAD